MPCVVIVTKLILARTMLESSLTLYRVYDARGCTPSYVIVR